MSDPLIGNILDAVRDRGVKAVLEYTEAFDHVRLSPDDLIWNPLAEAPAVIEPAVREAVDFAMDQIRRFHEATRPAPVTVNQAPGLILREVFQPLGRVGIYVPNGQFPLVSSLMMTAIPAQVAGVTDLVVAIAPRGHVTSDPVWLYVLQKLGIRQVLRVGGAQAIAALGYGLPGLPPVDLIAGPGNRYVAWAKQELFRRGVTGIDVIAGPSEVLVISQDTTLAPLVALDLLAQAEHDPDAKAYLVSWNPDLIAAVKDYIASHGNPADRLGQIEYIVVANADEAVQTANRIAPEHLGLIGAEVEPLWPQLTTAGALFVGRLAGQALGDYVAGPSHVLPTGHTGRFLSGLSTRTFMRRISVIQTEDSLPAAFLEAGQVLAHLEGLRYHEQSLAVRQQLRGREGF
ncbi:MAG: histidinol dehydrogenase [Sulfobacillus sp.]|nr:histidinol dehydrogenase [Sulfobacillus sp.]